VDGRVCEDGDEFGHVWLSDDACFGHMEPPSSFQTSTKVLQKHLRFQVIIAFLELFVNNIVVTVRLGHPFCKAICHV
jgi:hypothetical protein